MACKAIQYSDEMHCAPCGLRWDVNDPEPPACADEQAGPVCEDEGCPHYGTPHGHTSPSR